jgi:hypothetical protein
MRPLDLTAVYRLTAIEHVHEQLCVVGCGVNGVAQDLHFTPGPGNDRTFQMSISPSARLGRPQHVLTMTKAACLTSSHGTLRTQAAFGDAMEIVQCGKLSAC